MLALIGEFLPLLLKLLLFIGRASSITYYLPIVSKTVQGCLWTWKTWKNLESDCVTKETWKIKENFLKTWKIFFLA